MTILQQIESIEDRLEELRKRWREASPAMKKYIESGAKLHQEKIETLRKKIENDENQLSI